MIDLHTSVQTFLSDCNQNQSAKELVTRLLEALRVAEGEAADTVPRSRYDACNQDWLNEKDHTKMLRAISTRLCREYDGTIADLVERITALRSTLEQVKGIRANILLEQGCVTGYPEVLIDLIEEALRYSTTNQTPVLRQAERSNRYVRR